MYSYLTDLNPYRAGYGQIVVVADSAATVRDTLRDALTNMRVGHVMLLCQMGNMPDALAREHTQRFAQDVMPPLRELWSDYEERWYPQPLSNPSRPAS